MRIKGWMGRADQTPKIKGMFVRPEQIAEIGQRHPGRLRLVVTREGEAHVMTLKSECSSPSEPLRSEIASTRRAVTKLQGAVDLVAPGQLPNDGKIIADERT
jgi:phenylacetate-CoA ligase